MSHIFFSKKEQDSIVAAIKDAEADCSGEIRVHIDRTCAIDVLDAASNTFALLEMQKTALRNGVLFYIATNDHKFAVIGDVGINAKVPEEFWDDVKNLMSEHFANGDFTNGLCMAIRLCGSQLKRYFPHQADDVNELADDISYGN